MTLSGHLLASGAFVALLPLGLVVGSRFIRCSRDAVMFALPIGIAAMSIPLLIAALGGRFDARWIGGLGWILAGIASVALWKSRSPALATKWRAQAAGAARPRTMLVALLASAAVVYALAVVETPIGARDEGLYTLAALALGRAGNMLVVAPDALARQSHLFEPFVSGIAFHLPGIPATATLKPQFSPLLPAWIAQLHGSGGDALLYRFNLLVTLAGAGVTYALSRRVVRRSSAFVALALFLFNPAQVWIARINLAEPLGAMLVLAGLLAALDAVCRGGRTRTAVAIVLLSLAAYVRVDAIVVAPLLTASGIACALWGRHRAEAASLSRLGYLSLGGQALAVAALFAWSPAYVRDHLRILLLAPIAVVAGTFVYAATSSLRAHGRLGARAQRRAAMLVCAALLLLVAYAMLARPFVTPFALIPERGSALAGMRDYREDSLWNLAAYLTWPCIALAVTGVLVMLARAARGAATTTALTLTVFALGSGLVYLAAPSVSPDHPWAVRRMVMLVIPLVILMSGVGLQALLQRALRWRQAPFPEVAVIAVTGWLLVSQNATLAFTENAGVTAQLRAIDTALPRGTLIVRGFEGLATTLGLGFGRVVLPLRDEGVPVDASSRAFWAACATAPCTLLHASFEGLDGLILGPSREVRLERTYVEPDVHAPARERGHQTLRLFVSGVTGVAGTPPPPNAGAARDWRVDDSGFYRDELIPGMAVRWTTGDARLTLDSATADALELRVASDAPGAQSLQITVDGVRVVGETIRPGEARWRFPVRAGRHEIALRASTFVPADSRASGDKRSLGVSVRAVRLLDPGVPRLASESPAAEYRSRLTVQPTALNPDDQTRRTLAYRVDVDNLGRSEWPAAADVVAGEPAVALGVYFTQPGDATRLDEQRIALPYSLRPNEHWSTLLVVDAAGDTHHALVPGDYDLHVGLVFDGVSWFADRGERDVTTPITIAPR